MAEARIAALDHIRGLSVLGILIVNATAFAWPPSVYLDPAMSPLPLTPADRGAWWAMETFAHDKFVTLFSLLFGVSIFLVGRQALPGQPERDQPLMRRLFWLAVFGVVHGAVVWYGDILLQYAVVGFVFWRWKDEPARRLVQMGGLMFLAGAVAVLVQWFLPPPFQPEATADPAGIMRFMRGDVFSSLEGNFAIWSESIVSDVLGYGPTTLGLMMLGLGLFKFGVLKGEARTQVYLALMAAGAVSLGLIGCQAHVTAARNFPAPRIFGLYAVANTLLCLPVALGYAAVLILIARIKLGKLLLYPLACAGRMAFSNYLMQSLIMTGLFYGGRGPGWFGTMNLSGLAPIVAAIWIGQLAVSTLWLQAFRYGPFEWGWRCLTHRRRLRIRA